MTVNTAELPNRPFTLDDVTRIAAADPDHRFELSEGSLLIMPAAMWRHQEIGLLMCAWFIAHGYRGRVNIAPASGTAADNLNGRIPDLVVTTGPIADEAKACFKRDGRPAAGPSDDCPRCRSVRIQPRFPDETAPPQPFWLGRRFLDHRWRCRESNPGPSANCQGFSERSSLCLYSALPITRASWYDGPSRD